jgi:hypothetical protein
MPRMLRGCRHGRCKWWQKAARSGTRLADVEDDQRGAGSMSSKMSKRHAGQSSNGSLLTTAVRQGTI